MARIALVLLPGAVLFAVLAPRAHAFSLTPMSVTIEAGEKSASHSFTLDNNGPERIAVQVSMAKRKVALDGAESNPEAEDDFIVYPPQLVLGPNEKRSVRVTWAGDPKPSRELAYRIIAEQLPVDTTKPDRKAHAVIKVLLRYLGALYVSPRGARPSATLRKLSEQTVKGRRMLAVEIENTGTRHQIVRDAHLKLSSGGSTLTLGNGELKPLIGENLLAGGVRRFLVDWPHTLTSAAGLTGELDIGE